ncbi:DUF1553 domain-containing protein [bacterium]|nr:DUF1553 domain-containing protein [bacterium]
MLVPLARFSLVVVLLTYAVEPLQVAADEPIATEISVEGRDFFEKQVRPLLVQRCYECHGGTKAGGGLSLQTAKGWQHGGESGPAIVPGKPDESLLIEAIQYRSLEMPPSDAGGKLPDHEIAILSKWVAMGAPDPRDGRDIIGGMDRQAAESWWAFQPLPVLDAPLDVLRDAQHIDALLQREIEAQGLTAVDAADKRTLLRRLTYDLQGLPPTSESVAAFLADTSPTAFSKAIDQLLESPQYGVQWGRHWLDVVRYADTAGENTDRPLPHAWRYRNWVIDAFNRDLAYDEFVRMQIAGDLLSQDLDDNQRAEGIIATGYLAIARRFGHDIDKDMYLTYEDVIDNLGKNFLGLTLGCARCHDHKYDPVSAEDYYALYGIFESTQFAFPGCEPKGQPRDLVPLMKQAGIAALMAPWQAEVAKVVAEKQRRQMQAQAATETLRAHWVPSQKTLAKSPVGEGASVPFDERLMVHRGELMLLTVFPNASHGADSTLVEWTIRETAGDERTWSVAELVPELLRANPWPAGQEATWSFLDVTDGPVFLSEQRAGLSGNNQLSAWSLGSEPSVFVNSGEQPATVWTSLPARSFFVHPGHNRPVAVAWTSPVDGEIVVQGRVADAHPAGGDGVAFELNHLAASELGPALADVGRAAVGLPDAGPPPTIPVAYAVIDRDSKNTRFHERGDPEKLGAEIPRRWLTVFGGTEVPANTGSGRVALAEWVAHHPLMARVMVNRLWEWHFGKGLVRSSNDFGARGEPPSHPELLDFLAAKFVQSGYSVKAMHRLILHTAAYQRQSATPTATDPGNQWLAHFSRRRLSAEELRDSLLAVSGKLDMTLATAHPFPPEATWTFTQHNPFNAVYETDRRSAFLMVQRQRRHPFLALFDGADPNASTPTRQTTTVPTQALYFMNDPFFHEQAETFARSLLTIAEEDARLQDAYRQVLQRTPTSAEQQRLRRFVEQYPGSRAEQWAALARVLLASNEFLYVE